MDTVGHVFGLGHATLAGAANVEPPFHSQDQHVVLWRARLERAAYQEAKPAGRGSISVRLEFMPALTSLPSCS